MKKPYIPQIMKYEEIQVKIFNDRNFIKGVIHHVSLLLGRDLLSSGLVKKGNNLKINFREGCFTRSDKIINNIPLLTIDEVMQLTANHLDLGLKEITNKEAIRIIEVATGDKVVIKN